MDTTLPDQLQIYNWSDYMSPDCLKDFEKEYGVKVRESYYDGNESMFAKLQAGASGYDVIFPTDMWVSILRKSDLIQPLDMALIPNFKTSRRPVFQKPAFDNPDDAGRQEVLGAVHVRHDRLRGDARQGAGAAGSAGASSGTPPTSARSRC